MILEYFLRFNSLLKRVTEKVFCRIERTYSKIFPIFLQSAFKSTDNFKFAIAERLYINFRSLHQVSSYYLKNIYIRIITALFLCKYRQSAISIETNHLSFVDMNFIDFLDGLSAG